MREEHPCLFTALLAPLVRSGHYAQFSLDFYTTVLLVTFIIVRISWKSTRIQCLFVVGPPYNTLRSLPTLTKASIARSRWCFSCAAETCTRIRASPFGTTGKKKPIT